MLCKRRILGDDKAPATRCGGNPVQFAASRNFTQCRSAVLEVARFQSESFDCCLRKPAPRFDLLIRSHHCTDNCFGLLRILFGHEVTERTGEPPPNGSVVTSTTCHLPYLNRPLM